MDLKKEIFKGCASHSEFRFNCNPCLIKSVGNLCDIVQDIQNEKKHDTNSDN